MSARANSPVLTLPRLWVVELPDGTRRVARLVKHAFSGTAQAPLFDASEDEDAMELIDDVLFWAERLAAQDDERAAS